MNRAFFCITLIMSLLCSPLIRAMNASEPCPNPAPTVLNTQDTTLHNMENCLRAENLPLPAQLILNLLKISRLHARAEILAAHEQRAPTHAPVGDALEYLDAIGYARCVQAKRDHRCFMIGVGGASIVHRMRETDEALQLAETDPTQEAKILAILNNINITEQNLLPMVLDMETRASQEALQQALNHRSPFELLIISQQE